MWIEERGKVKYFLRSVFEIENKAVALSHLTACAQLQAPGNADSLFFQLKR